MVHATHSVVDGNRIRRVESREFARPDRERQRQQLREQDGLEHREAENATAAAMLARAEVLTVEGYRRLRERGADVIGEVLEIEARGRTCDGLRAEAVDAGLNEDVRNREHRLLHARREADLQHALHVPRVQANAVDPEPKWPFFMEQRAEHQRRRGEVREGGRERDTRHAHPEDDDKQKIQDDIQDTGEDHVHQRALRVSDRAEDRGAEIVECDEREAEHVDAEVQHRHVENLHRRADGFDERACDDEADGHQQETARNGHRDDRVDGIRHLVHAPATDQRRHDDIRTDRRTDQEVHEDTHVCNIGTDRREGIATRETADHCHIRRIKKMLQDTARCQRQCEQYELPEKPAMQHIDLVWICFHRHTPEILKLR